MEVVPDESITTATIAGSAFCGKPQHRTVDTEMSSNLSVETHPSSRSNRNGSLDFPDSRQDSPKEVGQPDAMMASDDMIQGTTSSTQRSRAFAIPVPTIPQSLTVRTRFVTNECRSRTDSSSSCSSAFEQKVALAPRFGKLERQDDTTGEPDRNLQENAGLFSLSGSMSSEFLEHQQHHPDHQQESLRHADRMALMMNSPTSTTARDFLREIQCPSMPMDDGEREGRLTSSRLNTGASSVPFPPLHSSRNPAHSNQRPPFHPPTSAAANPASPANGALYPHSVASVSSHPTLLREHTQTSPSPTNTIPGVDGVSCDGGREKPVISRCFAWSQDSQDERRIKKRARTIQGGGMNSSASSPLSTDTAEIMSPSSALETIRGSAAELSGATRFQPIQHASDEEHSPPHSESPTKVHWREKVDHSPQVLFRTTIQQQNQANNEDVAMGDGTDPPLETAAMEASMPPPIASALPASHYSFEST